MSELGIQWQRETDAVPKYNRLVLPTVLKSINCHTREFWQQLTNDNPDSIRIYRHYPNHDEWRDEPEQCAVNAVGVIGAEIGHILDLITHIEDNNEWVFPFFSDAEIDAADRYMETFIKTAWNGFGMRTVFLNSACGHWGDDVTVFQRTLQAAEQYGAVLGQHEYDYPTMDRIYRESGDYWLCGKWQKSMAAIKAAGYENIKVIITECGIDGGVADKPMKGWKSVPNALENYCASLLWYNDLLIADDDVLGTAIFIMSGEGMWSDFDIEGSEVPARIALFPTVPPPEPPEPPPEDEMEIRVVDQEYKEQTEEWAKTKYGVRWDRAEVADGEPVWRLVELWEHIGPTAHITQALDENGNPLENIIVAWRFSSLPEADIAGPNDWYKNFVYGPTNANGDVGPSMSTDSYIGEGECGPHQVWVHNDNIKSDLLKCIGMLAGTFHAKLDAKFKLMTGGDTPPPPVGDGKFMMVSDKNFTEGDQNQIIIDCQGERNFYDTRADVRVGEDPENPAWEDPNPTYPTSLTRYEITTEYTPSVGETDRLFWVCLHTPDGTPLGDWWDFHYETGKKGTWEIAVEWITPDEPIDGDLLEVTKKIYDEVKETRLLTAEIRDFFKEPPEEPPDPEPPKGYFGQYYTNRNLEGAPVVEQWDNAIFFDWGTGPPAEGIGSDDFSVRWTATRHFGAGVWRFHVNVDDGVRLYVDGQLLIDKWIPQAPTEYTAIVQLSEGEHDIKLEYYERGGGATCQMWYVKM